jgi:PAS domain S-box-containing protein
MKRIATPFHLRRRSDIEVRPDSHGEEMTRLQRCINDSLALLALPALWSGSEPSRIVSTVLGTLLEMLCLDFVYVRLKDPIDGAPIETLRVAPSQEPRFRPQQICEALDRCLKDSPGPEPLRVQSLVGDGDVSILPVRLGIGGEAGAIVAGSGRADFPRPTERLLISVAASQAFIGLQDARHLSEQRRVAKELDQRIAQRTRELAAANEELKQEIAERRLAEERLRQIVETTPECVKVIARDGTVLGVNPAGVAMAGAPSADVVVGRNFYDFLAPEDRERYREFHERVCAGQKGFLEFDIVGMQGDRRQMETHAAPLRNDDGSVAQLGVTRDITPRKQAEEKLRRSEAFLAEAQRLSSTGSFSWRISTGEITWSDELYHIFEFDPDASLTLELIRSRVHPEDILVFNDLVERARHGCSDLDCEHRLQMPDGSIKYLHVIAHGIGNANSALEYIGAVQDVTERHVSEEALAMARSELAHAARVMSFGALTASIAHEVNQPLAGIITNAGACLRMLDADPPNIEGARETARRTIRDGNRASEVVTRLRALFSKRGVTTESVDLNDATREVIALSIRDLQRARVILRTGLADDLPHVAGDRVQLQQVILNLLMNAADAMSGVEDRPRQLLVRTEQDEAGRVRLTVRDAGVGFEAHRAEKLFEAFYTTKRDGMGIGLSVSRSIIEGHDGRIWAAPNDGPGATFVFSIPRASGGETVGHNLGAAGRA